jgi:hypothetical protein
MSGLVTALAGGAVGSLIVLASSQIGKVLAARGEVRLHDLEARERNQQLVIWVDDETQKLVREMAGVKEHFSAGGAFASGHHRGDLADRKAGALHRYRDQEGKARIDLARLRASEGPWHRFWRWRWHSHTPALTVAKDVAPFLDRWREPVTSAGTTSSDVALVFDRTKRTTKDARKELPSLPLT